jgi:hypothetical protein
MNRRWWTSIWNLQVPGERRRCRSNRDLAAANQDGKSWQRQSSAAATARQVNQRPVHPRLLLRGIGGPELASRTHGFRQSLLDEGAKVGLDYAG